MSSVILNRFLSVSAGGNLVSLPGRSILDGPQGLMPLQSQLRNVSAEKLREMEWRWDEVYCAQYLDIGNTSQWFIE